MTGSSSKILLASDAQTPSRAKNIKKGSSLDPIYGRRKVKVYPIYESEFLQLSYFNTLSTCCFSVGSFFASDAAQHGIEKMFHSKSGIISVILFIVGLLTMYLRRRTVNHIKKDAEYNS